MKLQLLTLLLLNTYLLLGQTKKIVIAECNPFNNYSQNSAYLKSMNCLSNGYKVNQLNAGKLRTFVPLISQVSYPLNLQDAVLFEMESASKMGINAFRFPYYIMANPSYDEAFLEVLNQYFTTAQEKGLEFQFSIEVILRNNNKQISHQFYQKMLTDRLGKIFEGRQNSTSWLRDKEGNIMLFVRNPEYIEEYFYTKKHQQNAKEIKGLLEDISLQFNKVLSKVNASCSIVYYNNYIKDLNYAKKVSNYFSLMYYPPLKQFREKEMDNISVFCKRKMIPFIQPVYNQVHNNRLKWKSNNKYVGKAYKEELDPNDVYLNPNPKDFSKNFVKTLDQAIRRDADFIDLTSWNNYDEGSHIAPEMHLQFSLSEILKFKLSDWRNELTKVTEQCHINQYSTTSTYNLGTVDEVADKIAFELVTLLNSPADLYINGQFYQVLQSGLTVIDYPSEIAKAKKYSVRRGATKVFEQKLVQIPKREFSDTIYFSSSTADEKLWKEYTQSIINNYIQNQKSRFLLSSEETAMWYDALFTYTVQKRKNLLQHDINSSTYKSNREKYEKEYYNAIRGPLTKFNYDVFLEMENDQKRGKGIVTEDEKELLFLDYNLLPESHQGELK
ncbi:glycoside hydrolase family 71/99 protein [Flammeovirga agarivorans]|uniref:Uncharacterized protein n=1 Tax=Flammeovirga agarivorans TaxID=2726742 RepID=A0A7X8SQ06_9BACT|nr:hypothetical protein [Flammeovirga agarivorans]NLR94087.1 hypothetical protein [Flammeovirga agarivorans]